MQPTQFKDLFGGTWIGEHPTNEHNQYLVVRYDFSTGCRRSAQGLRWPRRQPMASDAADRTRPRQGRASRRR